MPERIVQNILMIAVDDLRPELNCYGKSKLYTPNIDRLAAESVLYERAYCQFPQCMPSRASLMSGRRPQRFCLWSNELCPNGEPTLPGWLKARGWKTLSVGKVYHEPLDDAFSWDELHMETFRHKPNGGMEHWFHDYQLPENKRKTDEKFRIGFPHYRQLRDALPPLAECADAPDSAYVDATVASRAIDCLQRHRHDAGGFFLAVGFYRPHLPWTAPKKYWDLYDRDAVDLAGNPFFPENGIGKSDLCDFMHYGDREVHELYSDIERYHDSDFPVLSEAKQRECVHAYWACVSFLDAQIGRVLTALEENGLAGSTAVILWGDNGWHLGEHKLWSKTTNFDESTRVPLLLKVPNQTNGERYAGLTELVDVYPAACDLLGLDQPGHLDGQSLPFGAKLASHQPKEAVGNVSWRGQTVVSDRYRLTYYPKAGVESHPDMIDGRGQYELFDHANDPGENVNVAGQPAYAAALADMKKRLNGLAAPRR